MIPEFQSRLEMGHVPAGPIAALAKQYIAAHPEDDAGALFARIFDPEGGKLYKLLSGDLEFIEFDVADRIACLVGDPVGFWRSPPMEQFYEGVNLVRKNHDSAPKDTKRCEAEGCSNVFVPNRRGRPQKYCSKTCRMTQRDRRREGRRTLQSKRFDTCPHGHDRSPENEVWEMGSRGKPVLRCRECLKEKQRARRARKRADLADAA